jgi:hypothetical protein
MSKRLIWTAIAATGLMIGSAANANHHEKGEKAMTAVAATDGKAVMIDGIQVAVCTKDVQDSCINPREAGLNWGNRPLDYWPGKPASDKGPAIEEPLASVEQTAIED